MSYKQLLKFYFFADGLNSVMDGLCLRFALSSANCFKECEYYAEKISGVIEAKRELNGLWLFLDGALCTMTERDRQALKGYASSAGKRESGFEGVGGVGRDRCAKEVHSAMMKFFRRIKGRLQKYAKQVNVLREYYSLICAPERT